MNVSIISHWNVYDMAFVAVLFMDSYNYDTYGGVSHLLPSFSSSFILLLPFLKFNKQMYNFNITEIIKKFPCFSFYFQDLNSPGKTKAG